MAFSYLGPESPRPFSVITEGFQNRYRIPIYPAWENFTFGEEYDEQLFSLMNKYLDLETTDRVCYIGDTKGSLAEALMDRFDILIIINLLSKFDDNLGTQGASKVPSSGINERRIVEVCLFCCCCFFFF